MMISLINDLNNHETGLPTCNDSSPAEDSQSSASLHLCQSLPNKAPWKAGRSFDDDLLLERPWACGGELILPCGYD